MLTPDGVGPFPAVVFVTGSGAQDRDEALLGHKPFLVIADHLARRGVASLRCDDRGFAKSTGNFATATSADFANDAEAGVRFLRGESSVLRSRIGMIGHSEGGMIAPMVAARSSDVAYIVLMAGPGIPGDSILYLQQRLVAAAAGAPPSQIEFGSRINRIAFSALRAGGDSAAIVARIRDSVAAAIATLPKADQPPVSAVMNQMASLFTPWFRYFLMYDPRPTLQRVHIPVLALNGTLDLQVPYKENLGAIDKALKAAGNRDYQIVELPNLNHLFQTTKTGAVSEYGQNTETVSPGALDIMSNWILKRAVVP
jgi:pimeloyl-ACP methyl ester carboxylesterase